MVPFTDAPRAFGTTKSSRTTNATDADATDADAATNDGSATGFFTGDGTAATATDAATTPATGYAPTANARRILKMPIGQMCGNPPRLKNGMLKPLHGNTRLSTVEENYQRDYFKGLPNKLEGIMTVGDARKYFTDQTGHKVVGVKEMHRLALHEWLPHTPQSNYLQQISLFILTQGEKM